MFFLKLSILTISRTHGRELFVGLPSESEEAKRVGPGSIITVKHSGVNVYGTLQYPKYYRERTDVTWNDLIQT
jgi:hypothetical protein